ncbi:YwdI family protein [Metabacillus sp. 84]|uniref:YwdI family protein n=1 Tax=unclassified Metabacillus TaxID=2675274 RepID=UPI003CF17768
MDISIHQLLNKMEAEVQAAKAAGSSQSIREKLLVVKSLCDVVLDEEPAQAPVKPKTSNADSISEYELHKMMGLSKPSAPKTIHSGERLEDEGANGSSLFDF